MRSTLRHILFGQTPFSPRNLFLSGEVGMVIDPGDLATLFQDSAGTTPVAANNDPVGRVTDKLKSSSVATQTTSTKRPLYKTGPNRLYFDADPDSLLITFPSAPGNSTVAYGVSDGEPVINYPVNISGTTYTIDPSVVGTFGPELVANGGFHSDTTGWSALNSATLSVVSGKLRVTSQSTYGAATQTLSLTVGRTYKITLDIAAPYNSSVQFTGTTVLSAAVRNGTFTVYAVATAANSTLIILANTTSGNSVDFDNVSVRELTGAAAQNTGLVIVNRALTAAETVKLTQYLKARS